MHIALPDLLRPLPIILRGKVSTTVDGQDGPGFHGSALLLLRDFPSAPGELDRKLAVENENSGRGKGGKAGVACNSS